MDTLDPILQQFRAALADLYGDRIDRVVLFGSRARGDAGNNSDYDIALFLRGAADLTEASFPAGLAAQLTEAYVYKEMADYNSGNAPAMTAITRHHAPSRAMTAINAAVQFIAAIRQALGS